MVHKFTKQSLSRGEGFKSFLQLKPQEILDKIGVEGEEVRLASFAKHMRNLIFHIDSNLILTNKRLIMISGQTLRGIFFDNLVTVDLQKSSWLETTYVLRSFDSLVVEYQLESQTERLGLWFSNGTIGAAASPDNEATDKLYEMLVKELDK